MSKPPCWPDDQPCPNWCAQERFERTVHNHQWLPAPWQGWRFAGRDLVAPDGSRFTSERLRGLAWRQEAEARRDAAQTRRNARKPQLVRVIVIDLAEYRHRGIAAA